MKPFFTECDSVEISANEYFDMIRKIEELTNQTIVQREDIHKLQRKLEYAEANNRVAASENWNKAREISNLKKRLDAGCNTCPDMENTKKKNDELKELVDFKRNQIEEQANTIRDLNKKLAELRAGANESSAEIHDLKRALKSAEDDILEYRKANYALRKQLESPCKSCNVFDSRLDDAEAALKDADAKIQSANDKATNAKKEAKQAKETAERYREENFILSRKVDQFKKLNDELIKDLARQQNAELILKFDRKGED